MHHEEIFQAIPGDYVGFNVDGVSRGDIRRGDIVGPLDNPPTVANEFNAQIRITKHPSAITVGYTLVLHCHTAQVACTIRELIKKINPATGEVIQENPEFLKTGDVAIVKMRPTRPMVIETNDKIPTLSKFIVKDRDEGETVAEGYCIKISN